MNGRLLTISVLAIVLFTGCDDDPFADPSVDVSGAWTFSADSADPPRIGACSGEMIGVTLPEVCDELRLELTQVDGEVTTVQTMEFCGLEHDFSGNVLGDGMGWQIDITDTSTSWFFLGTADVAGDAMSVEFELLTEVGLSGNCTVNGRYLATR